MFEQRNGDEDDCSGNLKEVMYIELDSCIKGTGVSLKFLENATAGGEGEYLQYMYSTANCTGTSQSEAIATTSCKDGSIILEHSAALDDSTSGTTGMVVGATAITVLAAQLISMIF